MARDAQNNQRLNGTWTIAQGQTYLTIAAWIYRNSSSFQFIGALAQNSNKTAIEHTSANVIVGHINSVAASSNGASVNSTVTGWNHYALVFNGSLTGNANRLKIFLNGTQQTLSFSGTIPSLTSSSSVTQAFNINFRATGTLYGTGQYAEIGVWQEALTQDEITALARSFTPDKIRPNKLAMYLPLVREIQDIKGHIALTDTATTVAAHPRIYP